MVANLVTVIVCLATIHYYIIIQTDNESVYGILLSIYPFIKHYTIVILS